MADQRNGISWTDETWNPVVGCSIVSPACTNCYAMAMAARIERMAPAQGRQTHYAGTTREVKGKPVWTGKLALAPGHVLTAPLRWRRPRRVFVNSMSDLFHEDMPDEWIDRVFAIMALSPQHTFQVLTKRAERMRGYVTSLSAHAERDSANGLTAYWQTRLCDANPVGTLPITKSDVDRALGRFPKFDYDPPTPSWPLPNVWLGVSAERQDEADLRIPHLLQTPAAVRFVSAEPLLGPIDFLTWLDGLDWIIAGGESGPGARPTHPDWVRSIRDQCAAAGVAFHFKQWGEWRYGSDFAPDAKVVLLDGRVLDAARDQLLAADRDARISDLNPTMMRRVGKARAGRMLDGVIHDAFPEARR